MFSGLSKWKQLGFPSWAGEFVYRIHWGRELPKAMKESFTLLPEVMARAQPWSPSHLPYSNCGLSFLFTEPSPEAGLAILQDPPAKQNCCSAGSPTHFWFRLRSVIQKAVIPRSALLISGAQNQLLLGEHESGTPPHAQTRPSGNLICCVCKTHWGLSTYPGHLTS